MPQPVRHTDCPVRSVVSIRSYPSFCIRFCFYAVSMVIGIRNHISRRIRFCQPVTVCIIGKRKRISQRVHAGKHTIHFIINKRTGISFPVRNCCYISCCIIRIISRVSLCIGLCRTPALCIISIGKDIPQRVRFRQTAVHGVIGIAPDISFSIRHAAYAGAVVSIMPCIAAGIRHGNRSVFPVISIGNPAALCICHRNQPVIFIIRVSGRAAVIVCHGFWQSCRIVGIMPLRAVLSGLLAHAPLRCIGIHGFHTLSVRHGGLISLSIVGTTLRAAVRIFYFDGAEAAVIIIDGMVSIGIHGLGSAVPVGKGHYASFRIRLADNAPLFIISIFHHTICIFIIPRCHPVRTVVGKTQYISCFVRHRHQISLFIISIADIISIRQPNRRNTVFPVKRYHVYFSGWGRDGRKPAVHAVGQRCPVAADVLQSGKLPICIKKMLLKIYRIRNSKPVPALRQGISLSGRRTKSVCFFCKRHNSACP